MNSWNSGALSVRAMRRVMPLIDWWMKLLRSSFFSKLSRHSTIFCRLCKHFISSSSAGRSCRNLSDR